MIGREFFMSAILLGSLVGCRPSGPTSKPAQIQPDSSVAESELQADADADRVRDGLYRSSDRAIEQGRREVLIIHDGEFRLIRAFRGGQIDEMRGEYYIEPNESHPDRPLLYLPDEQDKSYVAYNLIDYGGQYWTLERGGRPVRVAEADAGIYPRDLGWELVYIPGDLTEKLLEEHAQDLFRRILAPHQTPEVAYE